MTPSHSLEKNPDPNITASKTSVYNGKTSLHIIAGYKDMQPDLLACCEKLIALGIDIDAQYEGSTALDVALERKNNKLIELLIASKARVSEKSFNIANNYLVSPYRTIFGSVEHVKFVSKEDKKIHALVSNARKKQFSKLLKEIPHAYQYTE